MRRLAGSIALCLETAAGAPPAAAQHGEIQLGALASYGAPASIGAGAGPVAGIALGRLVYFGVRWVYHAGTAEQAERGGVPARVTTRTQLFMTDLGAMIPVGAVEVVPGVGFGAARFTQPGSRPRHATEVAVAPGVAVHVYLLGLVVIPEVQYYVIGSPDLPVPVSRNGLVATLRVAVPIEVRRVTR